MSADRRVDVMHARAVALATRPVYVMAHLAGWRAPARARRVRSVAEWCLSTFGRVCIIASAACDSLGGKSVPACLCIIAVLCRPVPSID